MPVTGNIQFFRCVLLGHVYGDFVIIFSRKGPAASANGINYVHLTAIPETSMLFPLKSSQFNSVAIRTHYPEMICGGMTA